MTSKIVWGRTSYGVSAAIAHETIMELASNGRVTPVVVVEASRPESAPLHDVFFSQSEAELAQEMRLRIARDLIAAIQVVRFDDETGEAEGEPVRCFAHSEDEDGPAYFVMARISSDESLRSKAIDEVSRLIAGLRRSLYGLEHSERALKLLAEIEDEIQSVKA